MKSLFVCNKEGHGKKEKEGKLAAESNDNKL
jgi:hypothetical protein